MAFNWILGRIIILCLSFLSLSIHTHTQTWSITKEGPCRDRSGRCVHIETLGPHNATTAIHTVPSTYLAHSAPGGKPKLVGVGEGVAEMSRDCSGIGDWGVAARSEGGAGGCMAGGVEDALRTTEVPLRATQEVSITRTPMLWGEHRDTPLPPWKQCL